MKVNEQTLQAWQSQREHGDITQIAKATGKSLPTIRLAFRGVASHALILAINAYYRRRKKQLDKSKAE